MKKGKYNAGMMRNRVTIQRNDLEADGGGGFADDWHSIATGIPAQLMPADENENVHGGQLETPTRLRVVMRYRDDIQPRMRLIEETLEQTFNIQSIINVEYRNRWLELVVTEGVAQ